MLDTARARIVRPTGGAVLTALVIAVVIAAAIAVRFVVVQQVSGDYRSFLSPWYDELTERGFAGLSGDFRTTTRPTCT